MIDNTKYLNGYIKRRCTKYKLLLTNSDISALLRENRFQTNAKHESIKPIK